MVTNIYECFVESTLAIALLVCFISSSPCELAIYYHCPLTEKETKAQKTLLICPRSQLVCGCTDVQMLVMGSLTPGLSWHSGTNSGCMDRERRHQSWEWRWRHPRKARSLGLRPSEESVRPAQASGGSRALDTLFLLVGDDKEHRGLGKEQIQKILMSANIWNGAIWYRTVGGTMRQWGTLSQSLLTAFGGERVISTSLVNKSIIST